MITSGGQACQVLLSVPNALLFLSHIPDLSTCPFRLCPPFYCVSVCVKHSSSLKAKLFYSDIFYYCSQILKPLYAVSRSQYNSTEISIYNIYIFALPFKKGLKKSGNGVKFRRLYFTAESISAQKTRHTLAAPGCRHFNTNILFREHKI